MKGRSLVKLHICASLVLLIMVFSFTLLSQPTSGTTSSSGKNSEFSVANSGKQRQKLALLIGVGEYLNKELISLPGSWAGRFALRPQALSRTCYLSPS